MPRFGSNCLRGLPREGKRPATPGSSPPPPNRAVRTWSSVGMSATCPVRMARCRALHSSPAVTAEGSNRAWATTRNATQRNATRRVHWGRRCARRSPCPSDGVLGGDGARRSTSCAAARRPRSAAPRKRPVPLCRAPPCTPQGSPLTHLEHAAGERVELRVDGQQQGRALAVGHVEDRARLRQRHVLDQQLLDAHRLHAARTRTRTCTELLALSVVFPRGGRREVLATLSPRVFGLEQLPPTGRSCWL